GEMAEAFEPGDHATTMGGGPVICAAALAVLQVIEEDELVANAVRVGRYLHDGLVALSSGHDLAAEVRGRGLLLALQLTGEAAGRVTELAQESGLLVNDVNPSTLRLTPALIVNEADCDRALEILDRALAAAGKEQG
ncbi:MAG: aminotransferase class III-fold pyridoxal phosphate-dependent enzyme, partial [Actinomycetota bacterium]